MSFATDLSFSPVLGTISEFIDYALFVVTIMIIWYIIKFFLVPKKEEDANEGEAFRNWLTERGEASKRKKEEKAEETKKKKDAKICSDLLSPTKGFIIRAEQKSDDVIDELRTQAAINLARAKAALTDVETNLSSAKRSLRAARIKSKGDRRTYMSNLEAQIDYLITDIITRTTKPNIPSNETDPRWATKVTQIINSLGQVKAGCGVLIQSIDKFIDDCTIENVNLGGGLRPRPGPSGSPGRGHP